MGCKYNLSTYVYFVCLARIDPYSTALVVSYTLALFLVDGIHSYIAIGLHHLFASLGVYRNSCIFVRQLIRLHRCTANELKLGIYLARTLGPAIN